MWLSQAKKTAALVAIVLFLLPFQIGCASQKRFATPDDAVSDLVQSMRDGDRPALKRILGPEADDLLFSGDPNVDKATAERFLKAFDEKHHLVNNQDGTITLNVGKEDWPMPIPIVKLL